MTTLSDLLNKMGMAQQSWTQQASQPQQTAYVNTPLGGGPQQAGGQTLYGNGSTITTSAGPYTLGGDYTYTNWPPPQTKFQCPLPKDVLEKMLVLGMSKSKAVLKQKISEAFEEWCKTGEMDVSILPMLLAAAMMFLELDKEKEGDASKQPTEEVVKANP